MYRGDIIQLRAIENEELSIIHKYINNENISRLTSHYWPSSLEEVTEEYMEYSANSLMGQYYGIDLDGEIIGFIKLTSIDWISRSGELTIVIGEENNRGKGLGSDALNTMLRVAFNVLNLYQVYLHVYLNNAIAVEFYKKQGFKQDGVIRSCRIIDGEYVSAIRMSILKSEFYQELLEG